MSLSISVNITCYHHGSALFFPKLYSIILPHLSRTYEIVQCEKQRLLTTYSTQMHSSILGDTVNIRENTWESNMST